MGCWDVCLIGLRPRMNWHSQWLKSCAVCILVINVSLWCLKSVPVSGPGVFSLVVQVFLNVCDVVWVIDMDVLNVRPSKFVWCVWDRDVVQCDVWCRVVSWCNFLRVCSFWGCCLYSIDGESRPSRSSHSFNKWHQETFSLVTPRVRSENRGEAIGSYPSIGLSYQFITISLWWRNSLFKWNVIFWTKSEHESEDKAVLPWLWICSDRTFAQRGGR